MIQTLPTDFPLPDGLPLLGQVFECVDDDFSGTPEVGSAYLLLPRKGHTYTLNEVHLGFDATRELAFAGNFAELPSLNLDSGLWLHRFRPLNNNPTVQYDFRYDTQRACSLLKCALKSYQIPGLEALNFGQTQHPSTGETVQLYRSLRI